MSMQKRALPSSSSGQPSQPKRPCVASIDQSEANLMRCCCLTKEDVRSVCTEVLECAKPDWVEYLQSCFRNVLKEELQRRSENDFQRLTEAVEPANSRSPHLRRANAESTANNEARDLRLQLQTKLSLPLFTGKKVEGEEGARIYVALIDGNTGDVVTSGPESSVKLYVVALEGDFNKENEDNWAPEEFENYVVKEREGRGPLLAGDLVVKLKGGVGELGELIFTDNSSWNRSKSFRIGLKVASGFCGNTRIREAKTDAFAVKEHRGEAYRKHHPPASDDELWRLENIAKDGKSHQKLSEAGIYKVEDFLLQLFTDPKKLREILGKSITEKKWDSLIRHAKTCKTKWKLYLDYPDGVTKHGAVFNTDGQLIGLVKDREYIATHRLSAQEKEHGDAIEEKALANLNDVRELSGETFSDSMQKNSSSSFSSQVFGGQIENFNHVQRYLAPPSFAAPVGPEAPLANVSSTAEGLSGATALAMPVQSQNTNSGNSMEISVDENFRLATHQPLSADRSNVLIPPGYHGINLQNAMPSHVINSSNQMDYTGYDNVLPQGNHVMEHLLSIDSGDWEEWLADNPPCNTGYDNVLPHGNHMMEELLSIDLDDLEEGFADNPPCNDPFSKTPLFDNGFVRGNGRGVIGWLKIKAVLQWGYFIRKRGVRIALLDESPIEVQACS